MKRSYSIVCLFATCALLLTSGCQKQADTSKEFKIEQAAPEKGSAPDAKNNIDIDSFRAGVSQPTETAANIPEKNKPAVYVPQTDKPQPAIKFETDLLDLGQIGPGAQTTGEFKFTNIGDDTLEIKNVTQCCGVVTQLDKDTYEPGESGILKIQYHAPGQPGVIRRQPIVQSNDPAQPNVALTVKVEIVQKVTCEPERITLFLDEENASCPKLKINSIDGQPFSIVNLKSTADCITADFDPSLEANQFVLELKVDMEKLTDNTKGSINIMLSHPECKTANVLFDVVPRFKVSPSMMIVFRAKPQEPITRQVSVLNNYKEDFEIESISSQENTIKLLNQSKIRNGYTLDIEITPPPDNGKQRFTDTLSINIKDGASITIPCNGYYLQASPKTVTQ